MSEGGQRAAIHAVRYTSETDLSASFPPVSSALSILRLYALTPSDLFFKWEAFLLSHASAASKNSAGSSAAKGAAPVPPFNLENLRELKKEIASSTAAAPGTIKRESINGHGNGSAAAVNRVKKLGGRAALDGMQVA